MRDRYMDKHQIKRSIGDHSLGLFDRVDVGSDSVETPGHWCDPENLRPSLSKNIIRGVGRVGVDRIVPAIPSFLAEQTAIRMIVAKDGNPGAARSCLTKKIGKLREIGVGQSLKI